MTAQSWSVVRSHETVARMITMAVQGAGNSAIAREFGVDRSTVHDVLTRHRAALDALRAELRLATAENWITSVVERQRLRAERAEVILAEADNPNLPLSDRLYAERLLIALLKDAAADSPCPCAPDAPGDRDPHAARAALAALVEPRRG